MNTEKGNDWIRLKSWQELAPGGVITNPGNSVEYLTGSWRIWRPVWNVEACIHCLNCWVFCPEEAVFLKDGYRKSGKLIKQMAGIDYSYCKGCGLCVRECLVNKKGAVSALTFVREEK